jgi:hypothetical protein
MQIRNTTRDVVLARAAEHAARYWDRLVGLLGRDGLADGTGLVLDPCNSVHMWFMRFPIDVVFASDDDRVVAVVPGLRPWAMTRPYFGARVAIELPAGVIARSGTVPGDQLAREPACA